MSDGDMFLAALGEVNPSQARCQEAAQKIADTLDDYTSAEVLLALCFHLHGMVSNTPAAARAGVLAGIMRLIDVDRGEA